MVVPWQSLVLYCPRPAGPSLPPLFPPLPDPPTPILPSLTNPLDMPKNGDEGNIHHVAERSHGNARLISLDLRPLPCRTCITAKVLSNIGDSSNLMVSHMSHQCSPEPPFSSVSEVLETSLLESAGHASLCLSCLLTCPAQT